MESEKHFKTVQNPSSEDPGNDLIGGEVSEVQLPHLQFDSKAFRDVGWDVEDDPEHIDESAAKTPLSDAYLARQKSRPKSAQRMRYEAEVQLVRKKLGDLEAMRQTLGLTQRKMCQLLLVDPSAWTRWTKGGETAPPHIYRMLQWYLALQDKYPALDAGFWLSTVARIRAPIENENNEKRIQAIQAEMYSLTQQLRRAERRFLWLLLAVLIASFALGLVLSVLI